jgi:ATP-dependent Lon protease
MIELDQIDKKAASVLDGYLVRKDLVRTFSRQFPVPTYVVEFMLGRYCASTVQEEIDEGLEIVQRQLKSRTVKAGEEELIQGQSAGNGRGEDHRPVTARVDNKGEYVASLPSLAPDGCSHQQRIGEPTRTHADGRLLCRARGDV